MQLLALVGALAALQLTRSVMQYASRVCAMPSMHN